MYQKSDLHTFRTEVQHELTNNILPFHMDIGIDHENGGFFGLIANDGSIRAEAPKGLVHNTRLLWTYSQAYRFLSDRFLLGDEAGTRYSGKVIRDANGNWVFMTGRFHTADGEFIGQLADPLPLKVEADGRLQVVLPEDFEP